VPLVRGSIRAAARVRRVRLRKSNYVKIIPTHMIREIMPGRQGSTMSSVKCDRCWHLDQQHQGVVALTSAEVIDLAGSGD